MSLVPAVHRSLRSNRIYFSSRIYHSVFE